MKKNSRMIGDEHVRNVHTALTKYINGKSVDCYDNSIKQTVYFICKLYPNIEQVECKFDFVSPDQTNDLILHSNGLEIPINLFLIKKGGRIQPKNPGAKSFLGKYFLNESLQIKFNKAFANEYLNYLKSLVNSKIGKHIIEDEKELKKIIRNKFPKFTAEINNFRDSFLYRIREVCFKLLSENYNSDSIGFLHAYNSFFMTKDVNIITYYGKEFYDVQVEIFNPGYPQYEDIKLYKIGKSTVGFKFNRIALTLRFKFESGPLSSIKLAASYEEFENVNEIEEINQSTITKMKKLMESYNYMYVKNHSNSIGKCHEAITYFWFVSKFPSIKQVQVDECVEIMNRYISNLSKDKLNILYSSSATIVPAILEKLTLKYNNFSLDSIELIPDSYVKDRLETGDIQLVILANNQYYVENVSLKALAKKNAKITTKNPGIGTILGSSYFNLGSMDSIVMEAKEKYNIGSFNHKESLEYLASELGEKLSLATQDQLKNGIANLLGKALMAITYYEEGISYCNEYSTINSTISVHKNSPTSIQNLLSWNEGQDVLNLRVKFSKGQSHGWSSIKLTSEYQVRVPERK
ncbi:hypothetical protein [Sutcliffiella horikoshii]|uniref:Uncharacterized protein n=1 Tax=Sutcliffiella horikoshii TaxID=79883 RepID=A0A5D4T7W8_9BACI|nr:hypothetical protein [Sutcliffiella horikoshii]TYS71743.1 hypothetical protein FZC75_11310 [Sutcliffiella horikoshii]